MKKFLSILILSTIAIPIALAQNVDLDPTVTPSDFDHETEITVEYDVTGTSLANLSGAWLWLFIPGGGADATSNVNPANSDPGKTDAAKFTKSEQGGSTLFTLTFIPKDMFSADICAQTQLGMIIKGNDWSDGQTDDSEIAMMQGAECGGGGGGSNDPVVTISPELPTIDDEITLTFDLKQAEDSRAAGLLGLTEGVYLWSGAGTSSNPFAFGPPGQNNFSVPYEPGEMTSQGNDVWTITLTPRDYYEIPQGTEITKLGLLLKNGDGTAQTEDIIVDIDPGDFITITAPTTEQLFVAIDDQITISAQASELGDLEILIDEGSGFVSVKTESNTSTISHDYTVTQARSISVKVTADYGEGNIVENTRELEFLIVGDTPVLDLPDGVVDGINYGSDDTKVTLVLTAPGKDFVYVVGDFNDWSLSDEYLMNVTPDGEKFWYELSGLTSGQAYVFQYWVDGTIKIGDPYAEQVADPWNDEFIPDEVFPNIPAYDKTEYQIATVLQTAQTPFDWAASEDTWERPDEQDLVIYELLVRDFVGSHYYQDVIDSLDYIKGLGVNAIELLPIMEFEGNESWGYNPMYHLAPDKYYGTKADLKEFIQVCHQNGIAVILDMVLNHAFGLSPLVKMYWDEVNNKPAADSPWFNQDATHPFNVGFDFNHESQYTKDFMDAVNLFWLREYHFDGYRFDLSKGFTQTNNPNDVGAWGNYDQSRIDLLKRMADVIWEFDQDAYIILEHFAASSEENELAAYDQGMLLWGNNTGDYGDLTTGISPGKNVFSASRASHVSYMESHDEERLMYKNHENGQSEGGYDIKDLATGLNRVKMASAFFFTLTGPKMFWQFEELGYDIDIDFNGRTGNKPLPWGTGNLGYYEDAERQKLYGVHAAIINLTHDFKDVFDNGTIDLDLAQPIKRIAIEHQTMDVVILGNFTTSTQDVEPEFTQTGSWFDFFTGESIDVSDVNASLEFFPGEFHIYTTQQLDVPEGNLVEFPEPVVASLDDRLDDGLILYPNPVKNVMKLNISGFNEIGSIQYSIFDLMGRTVRIENIRSEDQIDVSNLKNGIYSISIQAGNRSYIRKFLKHQ